MATSHRIWTSLPKPAARWSRLFALGILVGVLGGLVAAGLETAIHLGTRLAIGRVTHLDQPTVFQFDWRVLLFPALGGLASGLLVRIFCPFSRGHGTDMLIRAFHKSQGDLPLRAPAVRGVANIAVLSAGGSTGPEGPSAALGAALGSSVGRLFRLAPRERRVMLLAGCAAAVGAIFRCPLGGALFATSVPYREEEFESEAIVPAFVASVIGYSVFMSLLGGLGDQQYLLPGTGQLAFRSMLELLPYALLGMICGVVSIAFNVSLRFVERRAVPMMRLPRWFAPAIGGLLTGCIACALPQVMDGRYEFIRNILAGLDRVGVNAWWWVGLFGAIIVAKCAATACTVGSGGSGGALGPAVFLGGMCGAWLGALIHALMPAAFPAESRFREGLIAVGMGGVLAATMRTPLAAIVMVTEMTGSYGLIVPLMVVCVSAYVIGRPWGLNDEQVRSAAESPAHAGDAIVHLLESWRVGELMEPRWTPTVAPNASLGEMVRNIASGTRPVFAVAEGERLHGVVSVTDIRRIMEDPSLADAVIASDIMTQRLDVLRPDDDMYHAMSEFRRGTHDVLPVVSRRDGRWLGMLTRRRVYEMLHLKLSEAHRQVLREHDGLAAIGQEAEVQQLVMGVSPLRKDIVQRMEVPLDAIGKSLRTADFRRRYHVQVVAIERPDGSLQCPPELDAPLRADGRLVVIADAEAMADSPPSRD